MEMAKANEEGVLLIIDDEEEVVKSLKRNFRKKYQVHIATNAEEGYRLTQQFPVQVVISDQRMPGMKGTELFKKLRQERPDVVRLILTGYSDIDAIISAINDGSIFRYITKPWNPDELDAIVREAFELHELRANNKRLLHELQEANVTLEGKVEQRTTELTKINERLTQEVKDREKAEATARESKEKLQVILDSVRTGILIVDSENLVILYANLAAAEMAKIQRNDLIGENYTVFFAQETHYSYPTLETTWKIDNLESVFHTCEGEEIPVLKTVVALQLEGRRCFSRKLRQYPRAEESGSQESGPCIPASASSKIRGLWNACGRNCPRLQQPAGRNSGPHRSCTNGFFIRRRGPKQPFTGAPRLFASQGTDR